MSDSNKKIDEELPIIQQTYDLIKCYVPLLNKFRLILASAQGNVL